MKAERSMTLREEFQARRAASAPASGSLRLQQDLQAGVHPRAAKQAEKSRQRAAEHRRRTSKERVTDWETFERTRPEDGYMRLLPSGTRRTKVITPMSHESGT